MAAHILIIEDEPAIRRLLGFTLAGNGYGFAEAGTVEQAQGLVAEKTPDLILLDWMLPGISGIGFARRLKRDPKTRNIPIIMLSARGEEADKVKGLDTGADDYITKPFSTYELLARIRAVLRRAEQASTGNVVVAGGIHLDNLAHRVLIDRQALALSPTEFRLMGFFLTHPEQVCSRSQLLDAVWGRQAYIEERTVDVHIRRLRKLLAPHGKDRLIETVRSVGYRFSPGAAKA